MKTIKYITFYDEDNIDTRECSPAAINKSKYIIDSLNNIGYDVEVISPAWSNQKKGFYKGKKINRGKNEFIKFNSFGCNNKILKFLKRKYSYFQLLVYLLKNTNKKETIVVYHSVGLYRILKILKKKYDVNLILEVEEIYSNLRKLVKEKETEKKLFNLATKYICITNILNKKINEGKKRFCICHGTYKIENQISNKIDDNKIHIVYSGIIDQEKKGAFTALDICKYLDRNYMLHIIGFGNDNDIKMLQKKIKENNKKNHCLVVFDGLKKGNEYIEYIQKCHIGLSTQDPTGKYNETSFPSKVLAYLSNGLRVVSVDIPAIKTSDVGEILYYYKDNNPKEIAELINSIDINEEYDSRKLISKLDKKFCEDLKKILVEDDQSKFNNYKER